jgi:hypothetical protein
MSPDYDNPRAFMVFALMVSVFMLAFVFVTGTML